jgi:anaerobic selenocysteine-containing dehydrogenase
VADRVAKTTCYMCACRCRIDVHARDGKLRYINGNKDHPVNRGVLCGKGSAGIMQHYSPARLKKPLLSSGARGSGEFREIEWDEALSIAAERLENPGNGPEEARVLHGSRSVAISHRLAGKPFRHSEFRGAWRLLLSELGSWRSLFDRWLVLGIRRTRLGERTLFHAFRRRRGLRFQSHQNRHGKLKAPGAEVVSVNPCHTGYNAVADDWIGIRPGTYGLFVLAGMS